MFIDNNMSKNHTILEINTFDRIGLIYDLTKKLYKLGLKISSAKILTMGQGASEIFYVQDFKRNKIQSEYKINKLIHISALNPVENHPALYMKSKMLGEEKFQQLRETKGMEHDGLMLPAKIADTYFHIAQQHRSAWTHELDLRAFSDLAWWNHQNLF